MLGIHIGFDGHECEWLLMIGSLETGRVGWQRCVSAAYRRSSFVSFWSSLFVFFYSSSSIRRSRSGSFFFHLSLSLSLSVRPTATSLGNGFTCGRAHAKGGSSLAHFSKEISPSNVLQSVEINRLHVSTKALPLPLTSPPPTPPPDTLPRPISWFPIPGGFSKKMFSSFSLHQRFSFPFSSFTGFQLVLLGFTGFYWVLLGFT